MRLSPGAKRCVPRIRAEFPIDLLPLGEREKRAVFDVLHVVEVVGVRTGVELRGDVRHAFGASTRSLCADVTVRPFTISHELPGAPVLRHAHRGKPPTKVLAVGSHTPTATASPSPFWSWYVPPPLVNVVVVLPSARARSVCVGCSVVL